nr:MAG TPA: hypothetical protein [Caudoviricetes sp.]
MCKTVRRTFGRIHGFRSVKNLFRISTSWNCI